MLSTRLSLRTPAYSNLIFNTQSFPASLPHVEKCHFAPGLLNMALSYLRTAPSFGFPFFFVLPAGPSIDPQSSSALFAFELFLEVVFVDGFALGIKSQRSSPLFVWAVELLSTAQGSAIC
uniref:Uncharacterized protein n=1 Tax=Rhodosorus marinus TaxID=101924 RepID=A0A7S3A0P9_9RHOD